jgi:hypothetical protein
MSFIRKFPIRELGPILSRSVRIQRRVRKAGKDYDAA